MIKAKKTIKVRFECECCGRVLFFESDKPTLREAERDVLKKMNYIGARDGKTYCCKDCYNKSKKVNK